MAFVIACLLEMLLCTLQMRANIYQFFLEKRVKALILQRSRINDTGTFMFELSSLIFFFQKREEKYLKKICYIIELFSVVNVIKQLSFTLM